MKKASRVSVRRTFQLRLCGLQTQIIQLYRGQQKETNCNELKVSFFFIKLGGRRGIALSVKCLSQEHTIPGHNRAKTLDPGAWISDNRIDSQSLSESTFSTRN